MSSTSTPEVQASARQAAAPSPLFAGISRDLGIEVAVPASDVWSWHRLATRQAVPQDETGSRKEVAARRKGYAKQARYASGRLDEIERLLLHLHRGPCDTDDGWVWFEAACPFIVEKAEITKRSIYIMVLYWAIQYLPRLVEEVGLFRLAVEARAYAEKRSQAERDQADLGLPFVRWLPSNHELRDLLRPTWALVIGLQLKGWAAIDRPDEETLKQRATDLRRQRRHEQGVRPQKTRTREKDLAAMAADMGISLSTLKRRIRVERANQVDRKVSDPLTSTCRTDRFRSPEPSPSPTNDDQPTAAAPIDDTSQTVIAAANDDAPTPPPAPTTAPLTETGYTGRNLQMDAWEVKSVVDRHPALVDGLQRHLEAIDEAMVRTPAEKQKVVLRNLLRDRNLLAHRERRAREKFEAVVVPMAAFDGRNIAFTGDEVTELGIRYPALVDGLHKHMAELEGPLSRVPPPNRKGALRRMMGARNKLVLSRQRFDRVAA